MLECCCGERPSLNAYTTTYGECGANHEAARRGLNGRRLGDAAAHPWRYAEDREDAGLPY